ncbi:PilN domain-containing protein [Acidihalobacter ferrooxydans]|uniref:Pilus assembly protein PilN n=1 Tax=Acidihalobacter ferrooxydans TaxID=1765967 RepID=A0A1P8UKH0_9GAMM|nr:PilN domain-containing protein [Acidihalobacter ferrooxydans]APZ44320.1 pilus assembly protein PilN [Acidihalobacter ferrooxydans]
MAHINLLPWRAEHRKQQQRDFGALAVFSVIVAAIIVFLMHTYMDGLIQYQNERNQYLRNEITILNKKIAKIKELDKTKRDLLNRMKIVERLQSSRPSVVHMFDQLVTTLPPGLYLTDFSQNGDLIHLAGAAESNARVSEYMRNLDASPWFTDATLQIINAKNTPIGKISVFKLTVKTATPSEKSKQQRRQGG